MCCIYLSWNALSFPPLIMTLAVGFFFFLSSWESDCIPFSESFYHKWVLNFAKCFSCIYWCDHVIFSFSLLTWWIIWIDFQMLNQLCLPGINLTLLWCKILFTYLKNNLLFFCWWCLHLCSWEALVSTFLLLQCISLVWVWEQCCPQRINLQLFPLCLSSERDCRALV